MIHYQKFETIEEVAAYLLFEKVSFTYDRNYLRVTDRNFDTFETASYHADTRKLVLMDKGFEAVDFQILRKVYLDKA